MHLWDWIDCNQWRYPDMDAKMWVENSENLYPVLKEFYIFSNEMANKEDGMETKYYNMHDVKILYVLIKHSLWSIKYSPCILWKCTRGDAARHPDHICRLIIHREHVDLQKTIITKMYTINKCANPNTREKLWSWGSQRLGWWWNLCNFYYGIYPNHIRLDNQRFDVFHVSCDIAKLSLSSPRTFIFNDSCEVMDRFVDEFLSKRWGIVT